tara:strand:+ start:2277 stop:2624 length:348 start_codon:yes stop_codon:yes gene_type:complete
MSKQINARELAEIVATLLVKPELFGEFDMPGQHCSFMEDIGRVVATHCGGQINGVDGGSGDPSDRFNDDLGPLLSVAANDSLPSINKNVWAYHDLSGWEGVEVDGVETGTEVTSE